MTNNAMNQYNRLSVYIYYIGILCYALAYIFNLI